VHDAEVINRVAGVDGAVAIARRRAGNQYDPRAAARFCEVARSLFTRLESEPTWDAVLAAEPAPTRWLSPPEVDAVGKAIAKFVYLRTRYTAGHSTGVSRLAEETARVLRLSDHDVVAIRRAGLLHDLGGAGVPVAVWNKQAAWTPSEWECAKRHPALTELVLARSSSLSHLGMLAGLHHERLDGSGYRGMTASFLPLAARILAAADTYRTKIEPRPHRPALSSDAAAEEIRRLAERGQLDPEVARALVIGAGQEAPRQRREPPAGLSGREVEVLRLVARGLSNRQIARALSITPKTAGHHVQHIYVKLGVSTRVGATLFAVRHGFAEHLQ
jgi:HD-GYP domain-containing protein (c-di-GMP phosphodiesterase class II)